MNKLLTTKIKQKARWVNKRYPELLLLDLIQEGYELVIKLQKSKGKDVSIPYLLKALSFHFSNLMRATNTRRNIKIFSLLSLTDHTDLSTDKEFDELDNRIDRERFIKFIKDYNLTKVVTNLMAGLNPKEIAEENKMSVRSVYRCIARLVKLREAWER